MSDDRSKYDYMAGLFGPDLWDPPVDYDFEGAADASHDSGHEAGGREALSTCVPAPSYHCMHPACNYGKAFHSRWELDRHVRAVHTGLKDFFCPFLGCVQGSLLTAFTRPDKLTSYIKTCHGHDLQVPLFCPAVGCSAPPSNLHDLAAHIREDHLVDTNPRKQRERCGDQVEILRATGNAARVKNGQE